MASYNIYPIPREIHGPPYLDLLYGETTGRSDDGSTFELRDFSWKNLLFGSLGKDRRHIIHIHWETNIFGSKYSLVSIARMLTRYPLLWLMKVRGVRIVWTKHNMGAHDSSHPRLDNLGTEIMWHLADAIVIQEKTFAEAEIKRRKYANIQIVPPGNYIGVYGPLWQGDREKLRESFGIRAGETVILAIGSVRPYKELPSVIQAVKSANSRGAHLRLIIAGKASFEYAEVIKGEAGHGEAITLKFGYVPDEKISEYLAVADYTICYYTDSALGSAAIMVSLSYGVPVITRDFPASELVVLGKGGFVFHGKDDLVDILLNLSDAHKSGREEIIDTVKAQDWKSAGRKLREVYVRLWKKDNEN